MKSVIRVAEIFYSIQGESSFAGLPCTFIRLAGCNLACTYCDTPAAEMGGSPIGIPEILTQVRALRSPLVEVTGGEPLLQEATPTLCRTLLDAGFKVLIETNGTLPIASLDPRTIRIVDVKTPSSGMADRFFLPNLEELRPPDEVKFVLGDSADFAWSLAFFDRRLAGRGVEVLFSPTTPGLDPRLLAQWILDARRPLRLQIQLHKALGVP